MPQLAKVDGRLLPLVESSVRMGNAVRSVCATMNWRSACGTELRARSIGSELVIAVKTVRGGRWEEIEEKALD